MAAMSWQIIHMVNRPAAERATPVAGNDKAFLGIEGQRARIIGIDVEVQALRREPFGLGDQRAADPDAPIFRCDDKLIEIERARIDCDKSNHFLLADHFLSRLGHHDLRIGHQILAPLPAPPVEPPGEVDIRISLLPSVQPQRHRGVLVARRIIAAERKNAHVEIGAVAASRSAVFAASCNSRNSSRCMVSLPATTLPLVKMASPPSRSLMKPPAPRTKIDPAAKSTGGS